VALPLRMATTAFGAGDELWVGDGVGLVAAVLDGVGPGEAPEHPASRIVAARAAAE